MKKYVIKYPDGNYSRGQRGGHNTDQTPDINKARLFSNVACAKNSVGFEPGAEVVPVTVTVRESWPEVEEKIRRLAGNIGYQTGTLPAFTD